MRNVQRLGIGPVLAPKLVVRGRALSHLMPAVALNRIRVAHGLRRLPLRVAARRPGAQLIRLARRYSHLPPRAVIARFRASQRQLTAAQRG